MKVWNYYKTREVNIRLDKYLIKWDNFKGSGPEKRFVELIKPYWRSYTVLFQYRLPGSLFRFDFFCVSPLKLVVEISPEAHHSQYNKFFHKNRTGFYRSIKKDFSKIEWLEYNKIKILELNDEDLSAFSPRYIEDKFGISII